MKIIIPAIFTAALALAPITSTWAQDLNPGNSGGGHAPVAPPNYGTDDGANPALTTGSRLSVNSSLPAYENPTAPGATGSTIIPGDSSTISRDRRATVQQKTGGSASDAPG